MFNVTVIDGKRILKCIIVIATIIILSMLLKQSKNKDNANITVQTAVQKIDSYPFINCMNLNIASMRYLNNSNTERNDKKISFISSVLNSELAISNRIIAKNIDKNLDDTNLNIDDKSELLDTEIPDNIVTQIVDENNIKATYTNSYKNVEIKNKSGLELTEDILTPDVSLDNKKDIIIFHTHTTESYTPTEKFNYQMTGTYRTTDLNFSVARVGNDLTDLLTLKGYNVTHNTTLHDYPAYSGSYDRSYKTVSDMINDGNSSQLIIDLHRDAVGSGTDYGPTVKINDEVVAQLMIVVGTDAGGLEHPNWTENLKFAVKLQAKANEMYPGLFRPINLSSSRYNQHLSKGAIIIEVGATANTMEQCLGSMKYLASAIDEVMKE